MIEAIKAVKDSLAYAKFQDQAIKGAALRLLDELDTDLSAEEYEEGSAIEEARETLEQAILDTDSEREEAVATAQSKTDDSDEDDQFAGLGEDDEGAEQ
jgi:hypothetical protein